MQTNGLADTNAMVEDNFPEAYEEMKKSLVKNGCFLPKLESNMRNSINISKIKVEGISPWKMRSSIRRLKSHTSVIGEIPILINVKEENDWKTEKDDILKYCMEEMKRKDKKNVLVIYDYSGFKDVADDLTRIITDKTVVEYPSTHGKQKGFANVKSFVEKENHVLVTQNRYFNGCEASNVIFLNGYYEGVRNSLMRGVHNVICVKVGGQMIIRGMKEDNRFSGKKLEIQEATDECDNTENKSEVTKYFLNKLCCICM